MRVSDGRVRTLGKDDVIFAGWSPVDPGLLAFATTTSLYTVRGPGGPQLLATRPTLTCAACPSGTVVRWPAGDWLGWSPDGRWIGLGTFTGAVRLVGADTGALSTLLRETDAWMLVGQQWWP